MMAAVDHRVHHLVSVDGAVDDVAPALSAFRQRLRDGLLQLAGLGDPAALQTEGIRELHEVRAAVFQRRLGIPVVIDQALPLPDHAQILVVEDHGDDRQPINLRGSSVCRIRSTAILCTDKSCLSQV